MTANYCCVRDCAVGKTFNRLYIKLLLEARLRLFTYISTLRTPTNTSVHSFCTADQGDLLCRGGIFVHLAHSYAGYHYVQRSDDGDRHRKAFTLYHLPTPWADKLFSDHSHCWKNFHFLSVLIRNYTLRPLQPTTSLTITITQSHSNYNFIQCHPQSDSPENTSFARWKTPENSLIYSEHFPHSLSAAFRSENVASVGILFKRQSHLIPSSALSQILRRAAEGPVRFPFHKQPRASTGIPSKTTHRTRRTSG